MNSAEHPQVLRLAERLRGAGFDLFQPFAYPAYTRVVEPAWHVPLTEAFAGLECPLAVVVGNTRALWPHFLAWLEADPARKRLTDPLDTYTEAVFTQALSEGDVFGVWRGAWELPPRQVAIQRAAEVSGLAVLSPAGLCVRPDVGPWLALRGLFVLGLPWTEAYERTPVSSPCVGCAQPCVPPLRHALEQVRLHPEASAPVERFWEAWLAIRDACPVGVSSRYGAAQVRFHYRRRLEPGGE